MTAADDRPEDARHEDAPPDDAPPDDARPGDTGSGHFHDLPLDEELAWQQIIANYGDRAELGGAVDPADDRQDGTGQDGTGQDGTGLSDTGLADSGGNVAGSAFDTSYLDATDARSRDEMVGAGPVAPADPPRRRALDDEEHFVPPDPPPVPRGTPARRLAWAGLLLPPVIMVLAVGLRWALPSWAATGLVAAFVGGFVYLVATMPRDGGDGWGDGAVV